MIQMTAPEWSQHGACLHQDHIDDIGRSGCFRSHDDVIKRKHFPRNWPFVREIHRSPVNFPHKGQWLGALMFSLIYAWINDWVNNREAGDLRRQHGHYDVIVSSWPNAVIRPFYPRPNACVENTESSNMAYLTSVSVSEIGWHLYTMTVTIDFAGPFLESEMSSAVKFTDGTSVFPSLLLTNERVWVYASTWLIYLSSKMNNTSLTLICFQQSRHCQNYRSQRFLFTDYVVWANNYGLRVNISLEKIKVAFTTNMCRRYKTYHTGLHLLTWINFNPSMAK